jgi:hypothetical protein
MSPTATAAALVTAALLVAGPVTGQGRLDGAGVHACSSMNQLVFDLRSRALPADQARQRLQVIYDVARTSSSQNLRQIASAHAGQIATADGNLLLVMAEQFHAACR